MSCYENFKYVIKHLENILEVKPEIIVHDMHPAYLSTKYAQIQSFRKIQVQDHHAHMASCMGEHNLNEKVIGVIFDGTGLGLDSAIWRGEFFIGDKSSFKRVGQLEYVKIQGGDLAIKEPWRCALSYLDGLESEILNKFQWRFQEVGLEKIQLVKLALKNNINCFLSSSMGRLFDAVAVLCGIRNNITYDGQAAIELENIIDESVNEDYLCRIKEENGVFKIQYKDIIKGILEDLKNEQTSSKICAKFHKFQVMMKGYLLDSFMLQLQFWKMKKNIYSVKN